jgi:hypothetical protein
MRALWKRLCGGYVKSSLNVCGYEARAISKNLLCSCDLHTSVEHNGGSAPARAYHVGPIQDN